jgi:hypothetical protein
LFTLFAKSAVERAGDERLAKRNQAADEIWAQAFNKFGKLGVCSKYKLMQRLTKSCNLLPDRNN